MQSVLDTKTNYVTRPGTRGTKQVGKNACLVADEEEDTLVDSFFFIAWSPRAA